MSDSPEKEILNQLFVEDTTKYPVVEEKELVLEKNVESYIEKIEKEIYLMAPITDDSGQVIASPPAPQNPIITLPVTKTTFAAGLNLPVGESLRWLVEWCKRLLKVFGERATFREAEALV